MSTFTQIRTRCAVRFSDASNQIISDATWKDYVNQRYRMVDAASPFWPWKETRTTSATITAGSRTVAIPTGFTVMSVFNYTATNKMEPLESGTEALRLWPDQTERGTPLNYRVFNDDIEVYPLPDVDTTLYVEYLASVTALSADGDTPVFPSQFHDMLTEGALADAYLDDGNVEQYRIHEGLFQGMLKDLMVSLLDSRNERYTEIVDNYY